MNIHKLLPLFLGACIAGTAVGQDKAGTAREQPNQAKASASIKLRTSTPARAAASLKDSPQQDAQARRERAEKVAASLQKKTNDTANAAASNVK